MGFSTEKIEKKRQLYEVYAHILDYMPYGRPGARHWRRTGASVQVIGIEYFTLLEASVKGGVTLNSSDKVYIGKDPRDKIASIIGRIGYDELTTNAKMELETVIEQIVLNRENRFINFFNTAQPITPRKHSLELIPGIGKKYMRQMLNEREKTPFKSFEDLQKRANIPNPVKLVSKRILKELTETNKYRLFTRAS